MNQIKYFDESYLMVERWISYYYQMKEAINAIEEVLIRKNEMSESLKILEIGIGNGIFSTNIKNYLDTKKINYQYVTIDNNPDLKPQIVGDITELPFNDSFDIVFAFEVLEHISFDKAQSILKNITKLCRHYVIISVPHNSLYLSLSIKLPKLSTKTLLLPTMDIPRIFIPRGEHCWELGTSTVSYNTFKNFLREHFSIKKEFRNPSFPYHHFFILRVKK